MTGKKLEIIVRRLGNIPIIVEEVGSKKVWNDERLSYQMAYKIKVSFDGKSDYFFFTDSIQNYKCGVIGLDDFMLAKALHENLTGAYLHGTMSLEDFCKKFSMFTQEGCKIEYESMRDTYQKMKVVFGVKAFEMKEIASEIYERYNYFPSVRGEVVEHW